MSSSRLVAGGTSWWLKAMNEVTRILSDLAQGDAQAAGQLLPLVYDELRKLAAARMAEEAPGNTLNATALVHEAYLRLVGPDDAARWDNRGHFFAAAAEAMRRILVEAARRKRRPEARRRPSVRRLWTRLSPSLRSSGTDLVALDAALTGWRPRIRSSRRSWSSSATSPGFPSPRPPWRSGCPRGPPTAIWAFARAWLRRELADTAANPEK